MPACTKPVTAYRLFNREEIDNLECVTIIHEFKDCSETYSVFSIIIEIFSKQNTKNYRTLWNPLHHT